MRVFLLFLLICLAGLTTAHAGGKRDQMAGIAFHLETEPGENPKMVFNQFVAGQQRVFRRTPEVSAKDIAAFKPFPSEDGEGFGLLLQLKAGAVNRIAGVTAANNGRWLIARVNGRIVDGVVIDKQITDGQLVIWKGVAPSEIKALDKILPRIGEKKPRG
ncbi:MAG: hypothetical protein MUF31_15175 [Akkermansiaceae bacterium]|jgi:hypothetical protein|nr:hypothetical protein [Akkermansiaceae bacterium]